MLTLEELSGGKRADTEESNVLQMSQCQNTLILGLTSQTHLTKTSRYQKKGNPSVCIYSKNHNEIRFLLSVISPPSMTLGPNSQAVVQTPARHKS